VRPVDLDVPARTPVRVVLALGANLGDREATLRSALGALRAVEGLDDVTASGEYETPPVGGPEQPAYLNAVVLAATRLSPRAVLRAAQAVEDAHGRTRTVRWGSRTLDVDVLA
jgi:2-amino-4-hydroxy-6-hydroxymethyldihydropteridine diphosphokinase